MRILNIVRRYRLYGIEYLRHGKGWKMPETKLHFHGFISPETYFTDDFEDIIAYATAVARHMSYVLGSSVGIRHSNKTLKVVEYNNKYELDLTALNNQIRETEIELQRKADMRPSDALGRSCLI